MVKRQCISRLEECFVYTHLDLLGCLVAVDFFQVLKPELAVGSGVKK